ncbi:phenylalanine--tRNA ligase subunit beta [bacterium]|nr:phenylalanine--tRNA ligase subunit beta [bacterium]
MKFSYNFLQSFFKSKLPKPEKLADLLTYHFAEVEGISKQGKDFLLDIDIRPNRGPDCFSYMGIAREIGAILKLTPLLPKSKRAIKETSKIKELISISCQAKAGCLRYTGGIIKGVKVGSSPKWLKARLKSNNINPINNIVDATNYVMLETGQPLHAFDYDKIAGDKTKKIIVRRAKKGEKITTLDDREIKLDKDILIIADKKEPLAIAGIKGGKKAEITNKTTNILLEAANFDRILIRRASKKIGLKTDASRRFEYGIDPNLTQLGINRSLVLIQELAGGMIIPGRVDFYPKKPVPKRIKLELDYVEKLLGIKIPVKEIKDILRRLGFTFVPQVSALSKKQILIDVPSFRLDISYPEDIIEEIGRLYGYRKIPSKFPLVALIPPERNLEIFWENMIKDILKEAGFWEVYNYAFLSQEELDIFNLKNAVEVKNPVSIEYQFLAPSLVPNLIKDVAKNQEYFNDIRIFELSNVFQKTKKTKKGVIERKRLSVLISTEDLKPAEGFYQMKGVVDLLLNKLGISDIWYEEHRSTSWEGRYCAVIKIGGEEIGFLGNIDREVLDRLGVKNEAVIFDIDFDKLQKLASEENEYQPLSKYPAAVRDLAVLVPSDVKVIDVLNKINAAGGKLVRDVDLFDIYEGEELPEEKKNLAFHIIYQAPDRVLSSEEIDQLQEKIIEALEEEPEWEVRK